MILAILFPQRNVGRHGSGLIWWQHYAPLWPASRLSRGLQLTCQIFTWSCHWEHCKPKTECHVIIIWNV